MLVINFKNYIEGIRNWKKICKEANKIAKKYNKEIILALPTPFLSEAKKLFKEVKIFAQHVDNKEANRNTGYVTLESLKEAKVDGTLINHSEHRVSFGDIEKIVKKGKKLRIKVIVCVSNIKEAKKVSSLRPFAISFEPPSLIGSGRAVSKEMPEELVKFRNAVRKVSNRIKLLAGAGISNKEDVKMALSLGMNGVLVSSAIIKSKNYRKKIEELLT